MRGFLVDPNLARIPILRKTSSHSQSDRTKETFDFIQPSKRPWASPSYTMTACGWNLDQTHPLLDNIAVGIEQYRKKSLKLFCLDLHAEISSKSKVKTEYLTESLQIAIWFKVDVGEWSWYKSVPRVCRPVFRKGQPTQAVEVKEKGEWITLARLLEIYFPPPKNPVCATREQMSGWWDVNGKTFNWKKLPTELKTRVIEFCITPPNPPVHYRDDRVIHMWENPYAPAMFEIVALLRDWKHLLEADFQTRCITLRLCLTQSDKLPDGFGLYFSSSYHMLWSLQRLGQCAQVVEADSCIVDAQSKAAALLYYRYPKLYPELSRYATMMHGIRHLNLKLSTWDAMHFFKVSVGGFDQLRETGHTTYDIFNRLPNLKRVKILLPDDQRDRRYQFTVKLFHPVSRCHRTLHRYIYEAIAQMQAVSDFKVEVKRFMDSNERIRFEEMQSKAELSRKTTSQDLADLYADSTGGVRLDSPGGSLASGNSDPLEHGVTREAVQSVDELFPPLCKCTPSCSEIMSSRDRIRRYDDE